MSSWRGISRCWAGVCFLCLAIGYVPSSHRFLAPCPPLLMSFPCCTYAGMIFVLQDPEWVGASSSSFICTLYDLIDFVHVVPNVMIAGDWCALLNNIPVRYCVGTSRSRNPFVYCSNREWLFDDGNSDNPAIKGWLLLKRVVLISEKKMYIYTLLIPQ